MGLIYIAPKLAVDDRQMTFSMVQSGGPGGQNVNKVATSVLLRFRYKECDALTDEMKERLRKQYAGKINSMDELLIVSREFRTQEQNRAAVLKRLGEILQSVQKEPTVRIPTKAPKTPKGSGGPSTRRTEPKRTRNYDPDKWE